MNESGSSSEPRRPEMADQAEQVARALRSLPMGSYLAEALLRVMPAGLDYDSVKLFGRFIAHSSEEARAHERAIEAFSHALETSQLGIELKTRWTNAGGNLSQLRKLITMVAYRADVLRDPQQVSGQAYEHPTANPADLERFWSAGGHDLTELGGFLKETDREAMDYLPK